MNIVLPAAATQSHVDAICCPAGNHRGTSGSRYRGLGSAQFRSGGPGQRRSSLMEGSTVRRPSLYARNARLPTQLHGSQDPVVNKSCRVQYASPHQRGSPAERLVPATFAVFAQRVPVFRCLREQNASRCSGLRASTICCECHPIMRQVGAKPRRDMYDMKSLQMSLLWFT